MSMRHAFAHYLTFARLHAAVPADLIGIKHFSERLPEDARMSDEWWRAEIRRPDCHVLVATECNVVVGVGIIEHLPRAPEATITYLCVSPDARRRGVAQLLADTLVGRGRSEGAAIVRAADHGQIGLSALYDRSGFKCFGGGLWCFGLWDDHVSHSYSGLRVPQNMPVTQDDAAAQSLLLAMGSIDASMLLTPRARQVISHEVEDGGQDADAKSLAIAAAKRGFTVWMDAGIAYDVRMRLEPSRREAIIEDASGLTPERILGHLSRSHLCLLRLALPRLSGDKPTWYIVDGFDGYLFRVHDVTTIDDPGDPMVATAAELRLAMGQLAASDHLMVGRPL
jgi:ribosomal protein S18 acetylase RimI-like enzyme